MKILAFILAVLCLLALFATACVFDVTASAKIHDRAIGRIQIPSINADFDLVWSAKEKDAHQHNALLYKVQGCHHVGNHYGSMSPAGGQWKLENVKVGDKAYLEYTVANGGTVERYAYSYTCYAVMICDVVHMKMYHKGVEVRPYETTDLVCVTCVGRDSDRNYVCFFERVMP